MTDTNNELKKCISCEREENIVPLVSITYATNATWICTQCLPTLIHDPSRLQHKFQNMNTENPPEQLID